MKTSIPGRRDSAQSQQKISNAPSSRSHSGRLAQLSAIINQSPQVQAQLKFRDEIQNSEPVQRQMAWAIEINAAEINQEPPQMKLDSSRPRLLPPQSSENDPEAESASDSVAQRQADDPAQREAAPNSNRTGLPDQLKTGVENLSGISLDDVNVHYNSDKPAQLNALAYAQGRDIHVGPGQEKHLPHEAWHVVQQAQGRVKPTVQMKAGVPVNDDTHLEREADVMGAHAVQLARPLTSHFSNGTAANSSFPGVSVAQRQKDDTSKMEPGAGSELEKVISALKELLESSGENEQATELQAYLGELEEIAAEDDIALDSLALEVLDEEAKAKAGSSMRELVGSPLTGDSEGRQEVVQGNFIYNFFVWAAGWAYSNPIPVALVILAAALLKIRIERDRRRELNADVEAALQDVSDKELQAQLRQAWELLKAKGGKASFVDTAKSTGGYEKGKLVLNIARKNRRDSGDIAIAKRGIVIHELTHVAEVIANTKGLTDIPDDLSKIMETDLPDLADTVNDELFKSLDEKKNIFQAVTFRSSSEIADMYDYVEDRLKYAFQYLAEEGNKQRNFEFPTVLNEIIYVIDQKALQTSDDTLQKTKLYRQLIELQKTARQSRASRGKQD